MMVWRIVQTMAVTLTGQTADTPPRRNSDQAAERPMAESKELKLTLDGRDELDLTIGGGQPVSGVSGAEVRRRKPWCCSAFG